METTNVDEVKKHLNRRGRRMTPQRVAILRALRASRSHPTAEEIYDLVQGTLPRISLGTVYRNLQVLVDEGWAVRLPTAEGSHRFDGTVSEHHHAVCTRCDRIFDIELPEDPEMLRQVFRQSGFQVLTWRAEFEGLCKSCAPRSAAGD